MSLTSRSWRLANLETPDFSNANNYIVNHRTQSRPYAAVQRARRLLKLIRDVPLRSFLLSRAEFDPIALNDDLWHADRVLGAGQSGVVATWSRLDASGNVIDEVAVKSINIKPVPTWIGNAALTSEAVMHREINLQNCENIGHLRAYKAYERTIAAWNQNLSVTDPNEVVHHEYRFYQEVAPYGSLHALIVRYRYWRTLLPEAFLWHLFDSLAQVAQTMRACSPGHTLYGQTYPLNWTNSQFVDFDIKNENIVLGYQDRRAQTTATPVPTCGGTTRYNFPMIKMIDFGCASFTSSNDWRNPRFFFGYGTEMNQPPESIHYGCEWPQPGCGNADYHIQPAQDITSYQVGDMIEPMYFNQMNQQQKDQVLANAQYNFGLLEKFHVWAIGKVLFEAIVLDAQHYHRRDPQGFQHEADLYWSKSTFSYQEFQRNGGHQLGDFRVQPYKDTFLTGESPYSQELLDLIRDCLRPEVAQRIDVATLRNRTRAGMQRWDDGYVDGCEDTDHKASKGVDFPKLYYRANDINLMPDGKQPVTTDSTLYRAMQEKSPYDPDGVPLRPKWDKEEHGITMEETWKQHPNNPNNFTAIQRNLITHNGQLMIAGLAQLSNPPLAPDPILSPTSTEDPSDPEFRLQAKTRARGGRKKLSYKFSPAVQNPDSRANKKRLAAKNAGIPKVKSGSIAFIQARTRNAIRRLEAAEAAQRRRPPPGTVAGTGLPPPPPPPPPGGGAGAAGAAGTGGNGG